MIEGSHVKTGAGFPDARTVRILLSEAKEVEKQRVTLLHLSRPLLGGVELPEDPNELDVATFRRLTAILRAFPENELVFYQLDDVIQQAKDICNSEDRAEFERVEGELPDILREEWEAAVEELIRAGSFEDLDAGEHQQDPNTSHLLQMQQVAECYLMEQLHDYIFPKIVESCCEQDAALARILFRMRHYSPVDFGIRKEFQVRYVKYYCQRKLFLFTPLSRSLLVFRSESTRRASEYRAKENPARYAPDPKSMH